MQIIVYSCHITKKTRREINVYGYYDSNWGGDQDDGKSIIEYLFMIRAVLISWSSKKQAIVALSSCEAEFVEPLMQLANIFGWLED